MGCIVFHELCTIWNLLSYVEFVEWLHEGLAVYDASKNYRLHNW